MKALKTFTCLELGTVYKGREIKSCSESLKKSLIENKLVDAQPEVEQKQEPKKTKKAK